MLGKKNHQEMSSHHLLLNLRSVMNSDAPAQEKMDKIVTLIALEMHVPVCSFYLLRPGDILELFASYGLKKQALHKTTLRVGEGLIGEIAVQKKTLIFDDAWNHPSFMYRPETGEKAYKSLMGVPVTNGKQLLGVLTVQTQKHDSYNEEQTQMLETVAMVLTQMMDAAAGFQWTKTHRIQSSTNDTQTKLEGVRLTSGMAFGKAFVHSRVARIKDVVASDSSGAKELKRLKVALATMHKALSAMLAAPDLTDENAEIFETYQMFTKDRGWIARITNYIHTGLTAEAAVQKVADDIADRMSVVDDPYLKERAHDFQDLADRLQRYLAGRDVSAKNKRLSPDTILVAQAMGPADLLDYDRTKIKALVLEEASPTMHVVIVAKSLNIPVIGGVSDIASFVQNGDVLAVDGDSGFIYINPSDEVLKDFKTHIALSEKLHRKYAKLKDVPCHTLDGVDVSLNINAGLAIDMFALADGMADGIGLYRTELPFMSTAQLPDTQTQTEIYRRVLMNTNGKPVVFRTLDIGSDKVLPYLANRGEQNPAMGWRSIRISLDRRSILRAQLRAFIRAVNGGELYVMFPMIADVNEFIEAKKTLEIELAREKEKGGRLPSQVKVGTMLEVPSLAFQLPELLPLVDFISIGSNDFSQFLFATDRSDSTIWERYDVLSVPMLKALLYISNMCREFGVPCSVCGEMAGKPLDAMALVALGITRLSMNIGSLGAVKAMVLSMNTCEVREYLLSILTSKSHSLREKLRSYALDHDIAI